MKGVLLFALTIPIPVYAGEFMCQFNDRGWEEHRGGHRAFGSSPAVCSQAEEDCLDYHGQCRRIFAGWAKDCLRYWCVIDDGDYQIYAENFGPEDIRISGYGRLVQYNRDGRQISSDNVYPTETIDDDDQEEIADGWARDDAVRCRFEPRRIDARFRP